MVGPWDVDDPYAQYMDYSSVQQMAFVDMMVLDGGPDDDVLGCVVVVGWVLVTGKGRAWWHRSCCRVL